MIARKDYDVIVIGGGPAGLAAATASAAKGARTCLVEREERLGGILKQCVHDGFGLVRFGEQLAGPEYARRFIDLTARTDTEVHLETFVHAVRKEGGRHGERRYVLECINRGEGAWEASARALVLATGCRERTDRQVFIHGDRPAGILTAGLAQHLVNIEGLLPGRRAVILGSGDIGLIMARRLTLEGMEVEGVYELKGEPSGLSRNLRQCLEDFGIPLHLSTTVTEVHGSRRVEAVTVARVDARGQVQAGGARRIACDTLILSVGLIPENEIATSLGLSLDPATRGPRVDQEGESAVDGVFVCGNALHVNDLVDYVSESGEAAGAAAAAHALRATAKEGPAGAPREAVRLKAGPGLLYVVPQFLDSARAGKAVIYFRSNATLREGATVRLMAGEATILEKRYAALRPPEMERLEVDLASIPAGAESLLLGLERREAGRD
jgi:NADPH-dependent 2,4-dienoyl-CoA reductase/sulfur reductase-like enzyme